MPPMLQGSLVTVEQFEAMDEPGCRLDLVRGEVVRVTNAGWWHGAVAAAVCELLRNHVRTNRLGLVFAAETGFLLERGPDTVRSPDSAFVRTDRLPHQPRRGYLEGAPDLAVEVTSPDDSMTKVHEKALLWLRHGARLVWVVEPEARRVSVYRPARTIQLLVSDEVLRGDDDVLPGFSAAVAELFPQLP
jgi:Uma2 family endonuclease